MPHLLYIADPMCSWCWGFSPVVHAIRGCFGEALPIRLMMGGLRPGTTESMTDKAKASTREHWEHVQEASGQPFDFTFFEREGFVYDTEPACRAVVVVRRGAGMEQALSMLDAVHRAFYAQNRDVTDGEVLADVAAEMGLDRAVFLADFGSEEAGRETWTDFAIAQRAGITGFPTLLAGADEGGSYALVTQGFQRVEALVPPLEGWLRALAEAPGPGNGASAGPPA